MKNLPRLTTAFFLTSMGMALFGGVSLAHADQGADDARNTACSIYNNFNLGNSADALKNAFQNATKENTPDVINSGLFFARIGCLGVNNNSGPFGQAITNFKHSLDATPQDPLTAITKTLHLPTIGVGGPDSANVRRGVTKDDAIDQLGYLATHMPGATPQSPFVFPTLFGH